MAADDELEAMEQAAEASMHCPLCNQRAELGHCRVCRWLWCQQCDLTWNPKTGRWITDKEQGTRSDLAEESEGGV